MSHMAAAMISLLGMVLLIVQSGSNAWKIVSFSIYGCSLIFLFVCSTLHHAISSTEEVSVPTIHYVLIPRYFHSLTMVIGLFFAHATTMSAIMCVVQ